MTNPPFHWTLARAGEHPALARAEAPPGLLHPREAALLEQLVFPQRRKKWLLGRWAAKRLLAEATGAAPARLAVLNEPSGAPYAELDGTRVPLCLSISHRGDLGLAALAAAPRVPLGADLETIEPRDPALARQFFTDAEIAAATTDLLVARTWSAKEAVLKALGVGLRVDTRSVEISEPPPGASAPEGWRPLAVRVPGGAPVSASWRVEAGHVITVALM